MSIPEMRVLAPWGAAPHPKTDKPYQITIDTTQPNVFEEAHKAVRAMVEAALIRQGITSDMGYFRATIGDDGTVHIFASNTPFDEDEL
jgi:hypothetical protein